MRNRTLSRAACPSLQATEPSSRPQRQDAVGATQRQRRRTARRRAGLKDLARRPNSPKPRTGSTRRANTPLSLPCLRGRVVLVDFWTYTCINCIRTLPYLKAWDAAYRKDGLTIVGVETPEFAFEQRRVEREGRDRPVRVQIPRRPGQRNGHLERLRQRVLACRLPDRHEGPRPLRRLRRGRLRKTETAIRALLAEAGRESAGRAIPPPFVPSEVRRRRPTSGPRARRVGATARTQAFTTTARRSGDWD